MLADAVKSYNRVDNKYSSLENSLKSALNGRNNPTKDTHFIIIVYLCTQTHIAVVDTSDKTIGYITYQELESLIGVENFDICFYSKDSLSKKSLFYTGKELGVACVNEHDNYWVMSAKIYSASKYKLIPDLEKNSSYNEFMFSCMVDDINFEGYLVPVFCSFYTDVYKNPYTKTDVDENKLRLPISKMDEAFSGFGGVEVFDFCEVDYDNIPDSKDAAETYLEYGRNPDYYSDFGYCNVVIGLINVLNAKRSGRKYYTYRNEYIDNDYNVYTRFLRLDISSVFCKKFACEYVRNLNSISNKSIKAKIKDELGGVYEEFERLAKA